TGVGNDAESSTVYFTVRPHHTFPSKILITQPIHPENAGFGYFDIDFDSEDNLNLVWEEIIREPGGSCTVRIYYMRSQNSGDSWINLSEIGISGSVHNGDPAIAVDPSDNLHVTFSNLGEIYYQNSSDNGSSWSAPIFLYGTVGNYSYGVPDIDIDPSGRIYIIFKGPGGLYLTSSTDNGNTWSQPLNFINTSGGTSKPNISVDTAGTINIATNDQGDHFVFTRSTDYGSIWSTPFYPGASYLWSYGSRVAAHNPGDVFLLWYSKINADSENLIYFKRGENNGQIWTPNINIGENFTGEITTDSAGNVNTVLEKNFETAFKRSVNRGDTWEPPVTLDFILVRAMGLDQAGNIYIVGYAQWEYDIYLIRSDH
ncbi:exo-alpha-sialidase, partial [bacterium]|nr:exo-alpha-sialidase [bacterium]